MPIIFKPGQRYRMPVSFGPSISPRQGPDNARYDSSESPKTSVSISFLTNPEQLDPLLPPGLALFGDPVVTIEITYFTEIEWLAGRGYNTLGVKFPVRFQGERDSVTGPFLAVLWENMAEPIITGREELGFAKLFCEIPEPRVIKGTHHYAAKWDGHEFLRIRLANLIDATPPAPSWQADGVLHYRYVPKVGSPGESEVEYPVMTPMGGFSLKTDRYRSGDGSIEFIESSWEQLPTMHMLVNTLAALPVIKVLSAGIANQRGAKDLSDQRRIF